MASNSTTEPAAGPSAAAEERAGPASGWRGPLALEYRSRGGRTVLTRRRHQGPLLVQRTFHPEGAPCHSYLIHPPGGVAGGDRLVLDATLHPGSHALLTTPAAAKFYRTDGPLAHQTQTFSVGPGATLEFLPMETILHGGSRVHLDNRFDLAPDAVLCTWDLLCLGRPGSGDTYTGGRCRQDLRVHRDGAPILHERLDLVHGEPLLDRPWGLDGHTTVGTLIAVPAPEGTVARVREALEGCGVARFGVTAVGEAVVVRCLANGAEAGRACMERAWAALREPVTGRPPCPPRIWKT